MIIGAGLKIDHSDEAVAKREAAFEALEKNQAEEKAKAEEGQAILDSSDEAQKLIAEGGKAWANGGHARVYLTDDQKLALKGWTREGKVTRDKDGDKVSNNKTFQQIISVDYFDAKTGEYRR
jgi:hypothetical protein